MKNLLLSVFFLTCFSFHSFGAINEISIDDVSVVEGDTGTTDAQFTVTIANRASGTVTVDWATNFVTSDSSDFTADSGTLTFPDVTVTQTITIPISGDLAQEVDETFEINLTNATGSSVIVDAQGIGTITNDDIAPEITSSTAVQGVQDRAFSYQIAADNSPTSFSIANEPAGLTVDGAGLISWTPTSTGSFTVDVTATNVAGSDTETVTITVVAENSLSIDDVTVTEGNSGTTDAVFTVTLARTTTETVTVDWAASHGDTDASDFTATGATLTFNDPDTTQTITISINGDTDDESDETYSIVLSNASLADISDATGAGVINNDDAPPEITNAGSPVVAIQSRLLNFQIIATNSPTSYSLANEPTGMTISASGLISWTPDAAGTVTADVTATSTAGSDTETLTINVGAENSLSIDDVTVTEGDSGTKSADFTVTLVRSTNDTVNVDWALSFAGGDADSADASATGGTLTFTNGDPLTQTVSVLVNGDEVEEANETYSVVLSNPVLSVLSDDTGAGTITNDDTAPVITSSLTGDGINGRAFSYTITADNSPVSFAIANEPTGMTIAGSAISWTPDAAGNFSVDISATSPAGTDTETLAISVLEENSLSIDDVSVVEGDSGTINADFTVSLTRTTTDTVTVDWTTGAGDTDASDFSVTGATLSFPDGTDSQTITIPINGDIINEPDEGYTVDLSNPSFAVIADASGAGTIENDDLLPVITSSTTASGTQGLALTYQITADNAPTSYAISGEPAGMTVDSGTGVVSWTPSVFGDFTVQVTATSLKGTSDPQNVVFTILENSLEKALDNSTFTYVNGGSAPWFNQTVISNDGIDAARSGAVSDLQTSTFSFDVTSASDDYVTFFWKVSADVSDNLLVDVDNEVQNSISGDTDWRRATVAVPTGTSTVTFTYTKDTATSDLEDAGFVDQLALASTVAFPVITSDDYSFGVETVPFTYQIETDKPATLFGATGLPSWLSLDTATGEITGTPDVASGGEYEITLTAENASGSSEMIFTLTVVTPNTEVATPIGGGLTWIDTGDVNWFAQTTPSRDSSSVQSGAITHDQRSALTTVVQGPGEVDFFWKVDSEDTFDYLRLYVDNTLHSEITGDVDWTQVSLVFSDSEEHFIEFSYEKDGSGSGGADAGWVDSLEVNYIPGQVTGVTATDGTHDDKSTVTWSVPTEPAAVVTSYTIYRGATDDAAAATELVTGITTTTYDDTTGDPGVQYYYFVRAENTVGNGEFSVGELGHRNIATPAAPANLTATGSLDDVDLTWDASATAATYKVYRTTDSAVTPGDLLVEDLAATTYSDATASPGVEYHYSVAAVNIGGEGTASGLQAAARLLSPPTGLGATTDNASGIVLTWVAPTGTVTSYNVYRNSTDSFAGATVLASPTAITYTDTTINPGDTWHYWITAVSSITSVGESSESASANGVRLFVDPVGLEGADIPSTDPAVSDKGDLQDGAGRFHGMITQETGVDAAKDLGLGLGTATVSYSRKTGLGTVSMVLTYRSATYRIKGSGFDATRTEVTIPFSKKDTAKTPLEAVIKFSETDLTTNLRITGIVKEASGDEDTLSNIDLYQRVFHSRNNPSLVEGAFTAALPHDQAADHSTQPGGDGIATIKVAKSGSVKIKGTLGDGSAISVGTWMSPDYETALYRKLYSRDATGWIGGMVRINENQNFSAADGVLKWFKGDDTTGREKRYGDGFTLDQDIIVSSFTRPNTRAKQFLISDISEGDSNAILYLDGGAITPNIGVRKVTWNNKNKVTLENPEEGETIKMKLGTASGLVSGTYRHKGDGTVAKFKGIAFQEQDLIVGHLLGNGETGYFQIRGEGTPEMTVRKAADNSLVANLDLVTFSDTGHEGGISEVGFILENTGTTANLHLRERPVLTTDSPDDFTMSVDGAGYLKPGEKMLIRIAFQPQSSGTKNCTVTLLTNDESNNPFQIDFTAVAVAGTGGDGVEVLTPPSGLALPSDSKDVEAPATSRDFDQAAPGTYKGLITQDIAGNPAVGLASLKVSQLRSGDGYLSGSFKVGKTKISVKGNIDATGAFTGSVLGKADTDWDAFMSLQLSTEEYDQIVGTLSNTTTSETYSFTATPNRYHRSINPAPVSGRYTVVIPGTTELFTQLPGGHGYGTFNMSTGGTSRIALKMGDGKRITLSAAVSEDNQMQLFHTNLSGTVTFRPVNNVSDADGTLRWTKDANARDSLYPDGYAREVQFLASAYDSTTNDGWLLSDLVTSTGAATVDIESLSTTASLPVIWAVNNKVTYTPTGRERLTVKIKKTTGLVSGSWHDRENGKTRRSFGGVVYQLQNGVFGTYFDIGTTGRLQISAD